MGDNMKLINIKSKGIFVFKNTAQPGNQIETFNNAKNIFIIVCTASCIKSYIFNPLLLSLSLYKKYSVERSLEHLCFEIFTSDGSQTKIIELDLQGIIRIWNFNSCELLNIIKMENNNINDIYLYKNYLLIQQPEGLKELDIKSLKFVNFYKFSNDCENIIRIEHFKYGKCILCKEDHIIRCMFFK